MTGPDYCFWLPVSCQMVALPRHALQGPTPTIPYYLRENHTDATLIQNMPNQLLRSLLPGSQPTAAWMPARQPSIARAMTEMLDYLGSVLQPIARLQAPLPSVQPGAEPQPDVELPGHKAFALPLGLGPQIDLCMVPDAELVRGKKHLSFDRHGYLLVKVGRRSRRQGDWLIERGHRLILYSMWGPPTADIVRPVCMHACHNCRCLSPGGRAL